MATYVVKQGECLASVAFTHGFFWQTLWELPENAALKAARASPFVLMPGDAVTVPALRQKSAPCELDRRHRFRRKGVPEALRVQFLRGDQPRAGVPYTLVIDRVTTRGVTDGEGCVVARGVRPDAREAALTLHPPDAPEERYALELRALDPADKVSGAQARLANLGFYDGPVDGASSPAFVAALQSFQRARDVPVGEALDAATAAALVAAHGA